MSLAAGPLREGDRNPPVRLARLPSFSSGLANRARMELPPADAMPKRADRADGRCRGPR
jgi:hypothetical protein